MKTRLVSLVTGLVLALAVPGAYAQAIEQDDALAGTPTGKSNPYINAYTLYDADTGTVSHPSFGDVTQNYDSGAGTFAPAWGQSIEFDNAGGVMHNANGNLLVANYGNGFSGFEIYNVATDGSNTWAGVWSSHSEAGGVYGSGSSGMNLSKRGGGLSISPGNSRVAWFSSDGYTYTDGDGDSASGSQIMVLDYDAGSAPGTGHADYTGPGNTGAWIGGPRLTGNNQIGAAGRTFSTQGTTWLNDDVVLGFNGFGEVIAWDVSNVAPGSDSNPRGQQPTTTTPMAPNVDAGWSIVNAENSFVAQYTDILYYEDIDPDHVYASVTRSDEFYTSSLFRFSYNGDPTNPVLTVDGQIDGLESGIFNGDPAEAREIAFDSEGNLLFSCYAGSGSSNIIAKLDGANTDTPWTSGNPLSLIGVIATDSQYAPYTGLDVASSLGGQDLLLGDFDGNGAVNGLDIPDFKAALADPDAWAAANPGLPHPDQLGDFDGNGAFNGLDIPGFKGALSGAAVPEPTTLVLLGAGALALIRRRSA